MSETVQVRCAHTKLVDPKTLTPHPANPNEHPPKQLEQFKAILAFQGFRRPITVSLRSGFVTKGHGALAASLLAGYESVPIDEQQYGSEAEELADIVADNQLARMSAMNTEKLTTMLLSIKGQGLSPTLTALPERTIAKLLAVAAQPPPPTTAASSTAGGADQGAPKTEPADALVSLFYTREQHATFVAIAEFFQKELEVASMAEAVLQVLLSAHEAHTTDDASPDADESAEDQ